jgi:3-dehydroquinate dehydratase/shikimate dehydrogenase
MNVLDDNVVGIRAANTLCFKGAAVYGYNTDLEAAIQVLSQALEASGDGQEIFSEKNILILGAGGIARTIAWGLMREGAKVTVTARDYRKSETLANQLKCKSIDWPARQNFECHILINCTSAGMYPHMDETPFEEGWFDKHTLVFDTIYNPEQTMFIKLARQANCKTLTGVDMFAQQAARQFELFTDHPADLELMRYEVKRGTSAARY